MNFPDFRKRKVKPYSLSRFLCFLSRQIRNRDLLPAWYRKVMIESEETALIMAAFRAMVASGIMEDAVGEIDRYHALSVLGWAKTANISPKERALARKPLIRCHPLKPTEEMRLALAMMRKHDETLENGVRTQGTVI